jgi:hypothetical protein
MTWRNRNLRLLFQHITYHCLEVKCIDSPPSDWWFNGIHPLFLWKVKKQITYFAVEHNYFLFRNMRRKKYRNPCSDLFRPRGFQKDDAHRFQDNRQMKVVRLLTLGTGHLNSQGNIPSTHFYETLSWPHGHRAVGMVMSIKNSMTPSGIESITFWLVAQRLSQLRHACLI